MAPKKEKRTLAQRIQDKPDRVKRGKMVLSVKLGADALQKKGEQLAELVENIGSVEASRRETAAGFRARLKEMDKRLHELAVIVHQKLEDQEVEVETRIHLAHRAVQVVRLDTNEVVSTKEMTEEEYEKAAQLELPGSKPKRKGAAPSVEDEEPEEEDDAEPSDD
jgi:hypothetical protein